MAHYDLLMKQAEILTYNEASQEMTSEIVNIGVLQGKIATLAASPADTADEVFNLSNLHVFPGLIDSQVHFRDPGLTHKEDIHTGTSAAVLGGITSIFEMPNTVPSTTTEEAYQQKMKTAEMSAACNYGFFIGASAENTSKLAELERLPSCPGIKIFLGSSFGSLLIDSDTIFNEILKNGKRRVIIHSEDEKRLLERKHIAVEGAHPRFHPIWRDEESALISTRKSIQLAKKYNRPVHILHVSSSEEMAFLKQNKDIATVEILPQFLTLSSPECYERFGTFAQQNPPIRDKRHLEHLWNAVNDGTVDVIGSDHAPHTAEEKAKPYPSSPSGMPGVQTLVPLMLTHVHEGRLSLKHLIKLLTENPRRIFGAKNKGRIQVGYDADFTIVDLKKQTTIKKSWLASKSNWSPFVDMQVTGWPVMTILNGHVAMKDDQIISENLGRPVIFN